MRRREIIGVAFAALLLAAPAFAHDALVSDLNEISPENGFDVASPRIIIEHCISFVFVGPASKPLVFHQ